MFGQLHVNLKAQCNAENVSACLFVCLFFAVCSSFPSVKVQRACYELSLPQVLEVLFVAEHQPSLTKLEISGSTR